MNKMIRTCVVLFCCALSSALFAGSRTYNVGGISGSAYVYIEMYYGGDYTFELVDNSSSQTVAVMYSLASFNYSVEDNTWGDYYQGSSGEGDLYNSWGSWSLYDVPSGDYSVRVTDYTYPNWVYELSSVFM